MSQERTNGSKPEDVLPGERTFDVPGLKTHGQFLEHLEDGEVGEVISNLHENDKQIVAHWRPGRITLLIAGTVGLLGLAVAGGVLLKNRHGDDSNSQDIL